jgi:hypothetical protein
MMRRLVVAFAVFVVLGSVASSAWGQFLSHEERKGMFTVSVGYTMRDYDLDFRGSSMPLDEIDEIFRSFSSGEDLDSLELSVAWISFGYVELRGTVGLVDYDLTNTHSADPGLNTPLASSDNLLYGLSAVIRYPLTDWLLIALEIELMMSQFEDVEGETAQLDVYPRVTSTLEDIDWRELTITPMVQLRYGDFLPYFGVRFSDITTEINTVLSSTVTDKTYDRTIEYENENELGAVVGLTWRVSSLIMVDAQAQFINNERYSIAVMLTF